jgi:hypothetical protein
MGMHSHNLSPLEKMRKLDIFAASGNCAQQQEIEVKTAIAAMILAAGSAVLIDVAVPTPAAAGWCIEACGLVREQRQQQTREVVCTTVRRGNRSETVCTSN